MLPVAEPHKGEGVERLALGAYEADDAGDGGEHGGAGKGVAAIEHGEAGVHSLNSPGVGCPCRLRDTGARAVCGGIRLPTPNGCYRTRLSARRKASFRLDGGL